MNDFDILKQRIRERLDELELIIGTTPPDEDDEYFAEHVCEFDDLTNLLRQLNNEN